MTVSRAAIICKIKWGNLKAIKLIDFKKLIVIVINLSIIKIFRERSKKLPITQSRVEFRNFKQHESKKMDESISD